MCDALIHLFRVCWQLFMGVSYVHVQNAHTSQKYRVFSFAFRFFLLLEALGGFVRFWEVLEVVGNLRDGLGGFGSLCGLCEVL